MRLLPAVLVVSALACGPRGVLPEEALRLRVEALAAGGDSLGLAKLAARQCNHGSATVKVNCYEEYFVSVAGSDRVRLALGALAALAKDHPEVALDGHGYTHVIGIRAWKPNLDVAAVFKGCTGLFQSGCYHGVIQAYLLEGKVGPIDSMRAANLCDQVAASHTEMWLRFQCVHGLGHGFEMINNWNLPKALKQCDWLPSPWDRSSCYGGAFMENAVASMPGGHHTAMHALATEKVFDSSKGVAGGDNHDMPGMVMPKTPDLKAITFKMRDPTDPLYPCSAVDTTYQFACYQMQGGMILTGVKGDFARATAACDRVGPPLLRSQCYLSLGTNASGWTAQNTPLVIKDCLHGDTAYQPFCFVGAVKNYVDVTANPDDGLAFCRQMEPGVNRDHCYNAVGEEISVLYRDPDLREKACLKAGGDGEAMCRIGAQLPEKHEKR